MCVGDGSVESVQVVCRRSAYTCLFLQLFFETERGKRFIIRASPMQMAACFPIATALPEPMHSHRKEVGFDAVHAALVSPDRSRDALHTMAPLPSDERPLQIRVAVS